MQKKLIALAVAGLVSGGAFAQSNVTIYGTLNGTFGAGSASGAIASNCGAQAVANAENCSINSRNLLLDNSSNLGFKGEESLGGSLKTVWQIESGVQGMFDGRASAVPTGQTWAGRNSKLALVGNLGEINYGFWDTPYHMASGAYELWGAAVGSNATHSASLMSGSHGIQAATANATAAIMGNGTGVRAYAISYYTPVMAGVQAKFAYIPNERRQSATAVATNLSTFNPSAWSMNLTYNNGPLALAGAYESRKDYSATNNAATAATGFGVHNGTPAAASVLAVAAGGSAVVGQATQLASLALANVGGSKDTFWRLGGKYGFGPVTVSLAYDRSEWKLNENGNVPVINQVLSYKRNVWFLGAAYAMANHTFGFQYSSANNGTATCTTGTVICSTDGMSAKQWSLGYNYAFSKRTAGYLNWTRINNSTNAFYDFAITPIGVGVNNRGADPQFVGAGLRHTF